MADDIIRVTVTELLVSFRGEDHTILVDLHGGWSIYRGGDNNEIMNLTTNEFNQLNDYVYDRRTR